MVIDQIVAELRYIQKEPKITNFASSTTLNKTRKEITEKCCEQFISENNFESYKIKFNYNGNIAKYNVSVNMPVIASKI